MNELAKKRLSINFKQSLKYLMLVFNDFFIIALIFMFGALMFWYAQSMKTMPANLWFYKPIVGAVLWLPLLAGHLVTLVKKADLQFLFTQDEQMDDYLKPMLAYSLILPTILLLLVAGILFPFATVKAGISPLNYGLSVIIAFLFKFTQLEIEKKNLLFGNKISDWLINLLTLLVLSFGMYYPLIIIVGLGIVLSMVGYFIARKNQMFDWRYAVNKEQARKNRVYALFSMFTDVEEKQVDIKRRKYLDFLLPKSLAKENPNKFLYRRSLLRNPENLNLFVRMTVFAILVSWLVQNWAWALGMSALIIFLTVYQLLPMVNEFDSNIMYRVYPIVRKNRGQDLVKVLTSGLLIQWLLISVFWLLLLPIDLHLLEAIILLLVFTLLVTLIYLPYKTKKN
ncbi:ABC transporter permease [Lactobacillus acetotolerans]|jgi:ABC-2 type transport system permease protein|uniref:ABC transporter permease n=1 Tax=Lactobacillus acetotolerans TaxID=1600 RepID=UPI0007B984DB|nr:ABC transporter permease [Lactobacillus acetotolerans]MBN7276355.1 ABC transporter permease [Lactobacillus acetotolerans]QGV04897.1 ABC transporter permease [Lactobacillus acetotolerans]QJD73821.1 ABC transporter permease [Lactobacillus acetotolerans]HBQ43179.1 ABC transporter permease [Lactobacillus acetotolerans]HCX39576.1 ABC transporter permease [Lactobacillus acetotolerans]